MTSIPNPSPGPPPAPGKKLLAAAEHQWEEFMSPGMQRYAKVILERGIRNRELAEEALQEVRMSLWEFFTHQTADDLQKYVGSVCRNKCIEYHRRAVKMAECVLAERILLEEVSSVNVDQDFAAVAQDYLPVLRKHLNKDAATIYLLKHVFDLTYKEIGRAMSPEITAGGARLSVWRSTQKLDKPEIKHELRRQLGL
jgi:DNA-directed RNA polymerase specialized sigma24 family protein